MEKAEKEAFVYACMRLYAKYADNDKDKENDNENDNEKDKEKENEKENENTLT